MQILKMCNADLHGFFHETQGNQMLSREILNILARIKLKTNYFRWTNVPLIFRS